jgi:hypothetical protein
MQVLAVAESVLGCAVGAQEPLMQAGLDSLGVVELRNALSARLGLQLPATVVLDHPTPQALADCIAGEATCLASSSAESDSKQGNVLADMPGTRRYHFHRMNG